MSDDIKYASPIKINWIGSLIQEAANDDIPISSWGLSFNAKYILAG